MASFATHAWPRSAPSWALSRYVHMRSNQLIELDHPWVECGHAGKAPRPLYLAPAEGCDQGTRRRGAIPAVAIILDFTPRARPAWCFLSRSLYLPSHCTLPSSTTGARHDRRSDVVRYAVQQFR